MRKQIKKTGLTFVCLAAAALGAIPCFAYTTPQQVDGPTTYDYKKFATEEDYETELQNKMPDVYDAIGSYILEDEICPIPGIINTCYSEGDNILNSMYYIPQGLCRTDDYILVTAYHDGKIGDTVIESKEGWSGALYVIDADTMDLLCTLGLPQDYHNGGIAFDGENVWFCGDTSDKYLNNGGKTFVQSCKYSKLKKLVKKASASEYKSGAVAKEDFSEEIYIDNKTSFMTCADGMLWVGTYANNEPDEYNGFAVGYPIVNAKDASPQLDVLNVKRINGIPSSAQGMDIDGNDLYISSSGHGGENFIHSSFVTRYDISELFSGSILVDVEGQALKKIEVPKMNEEVIVDENTVSLVFEASAEKFLASMPDGMKTDRILVIDKSLWE